MKKNLFAIIMFFLSFCTLAQVPASGLIASYSFDGHLQADNALYNLTPSGDVQYASGRSGQSNCALYTFGSGSPSVSASASNANGPTVGSGNFTISFWFKADQSGYTTGSVYTSGCYSQGFPQSPRFSCADGRSALASQTQFDHFTIIRKDDSITVYKNAVLACRYQYISSACLTTQAVTIGRDLGGYLDDMYIYNRAVTPGEILELKAARSSCDVATGLQENRSFSNSISLVPNPSTGGQFQIISLVPITAIEAWDLTGQPVSVYRQSSTFSIPEKGMYMVKMTTAEGTKVVRAVVE